MSKHQNELAALAANDREMAEKQRNDRDRLTAARAALASGNYAEITPKVITSQTPGSIPPPLGSGYYAAQGALHQAAMNERFAKEREAEAKACQESPTILQRITNFFRNKFITIQNYFSSKSKATTNSAPPKDPAPPTETQTLADRIIKGAKAKQEFYDEAARRRAAEEKSQRPNVMKRIFAYFYEMFVALKNKFTRTKPTRPQNDRTVPPVVTAEASDLLSQEPLGNTDVPPITIPGTTDDAH